ncbi:MAG: hypothetical protein ACYDAO_04300 [Thermoplasmataceae archaeon]
MDRSQFSNLIREIEKQNDYELFFKLSHFIDSHKDNFTPDQFSEARKIWDEQHKKFTPKNCHDIDKIGLRHKGIKYATNLSHDDSLGDCVAAQEFGLTLPEYMQKFYPTIDSWTISYRAKSEPPANFFIPINQKPAPVPKNTIQINENALIEQRLNELEEEIRTRTEELANEIKKKVLIPSGTSIEAPKTQHIYKTIPTWLYRQISNPKFKFPHPIKIIRTEKGNVTLSISGSSDMEIDNLFRPLYEAHEEHVFAASSGKRATPNIRETPTYQEILRILGKRYTNLTGYEPNTAFQGLVARISMFVRNHNLDYQALNLDFDLLLLPGSKKQYSADLAHEAFAEFIKANNLQTYVAQDQTDDNPVCDPALLHEAIIKLYALYAISQESGLNNVGDRLLHENEDILSECGYEKDDYPTLIREADTELKSQSDGKYGAADEVNAQIKRYDSYRMDEEL